MTTNNFSIDRNIAGASTFAQPELRNWLVTSEKQLREDGENFFAFNFFRQFSVINLCNFYTTNVGERDAFFGNVLKECAPNSNVYVCFEDQIQAVLAHVKKLPTKAKKVLICHCAPETEVTINTENQFAVCFFLFPENSSHPSKKTTIIQGGAKKFKLFVAGSRSKYSGNLQVIVDPSSSRIDDEKESKAFDHLFYGEGDTDPRTKTSAAYYRSNNPLSYPRKPKIISFRAKADETINIRCEYLEQQETYVFVQGNFGPDAMKSKKCLELANQDPDKSIKVVFTNATNETVNNGIDKKEDSVVYFTAENMSEKKNTGSMSSPEELYFFHYMSPFEQLFSQEISNYVWEHSGFEFKNLGRESLIGALCGMSEPSEKLIQCVKRFYSYLDRHENYQLTETFRSKKSMLNLFAIKNEKKGGSLSILFKDVQNRFDNLSLNEKKKLVDNYERALKISATVPVSYPFMRERLVLSREDIMLINDFIQQTKDTETVFDENTQKCSFEEKPEEGKILFENKKSLMIDISNIDGNKNTIYVKNCDLLIVVGSANTNLVIYLLGKFHTVINNVVNNNKVKFVSDNVSTLRTKIGENVYDSFVSYKDNLGTDSIRRTVDKANRGTEIRALRVVTVIPQRTIIRNFYGKCDLFDTSLVMSRFNIN